MNIFVNVLTDAVHSPISWPLHLCKRAFPRSSHCCSDVIDCLHPNRVSQSHFWFLTGESVEVAYVDQGYNGAAAKAVAAEHGIALQVVSLPEAKKGFVLLPRRWVVERSFAWTARRRRLARDYERLSTTLAGLHFVAFAMFMLTRLLGGNPWQGA